MEDEDFVFAQIRRMLKRLWAKNMAFGDAAFAFFRRKQGLTGWPHMLHQFFKPFTPLGLSVVYSMLHQRPILHNSSDDDSEVIKAIIMLGLGEECAPEVNCLQFADLLDHVTSHGAQSANQIELILCNEHNLFGTRLIEPEIPDTYIWENVCFAISLTLCVRRCRLLYEGWGHINTGPSLAASINNTIEYLEAPLKQWILPLGDKTGPIPLFEAWKENARHETRDVQVQ